MDTAKYKPGDGLLIEHYGSHHAVVLAVEDGVLVVVICGTSKRKDHLSAEEICIKPKSPAANMLGLDRPTYFYPHKIATITDENKILKKFKHCPPNIYEKLRGLLKIHEQRQATNRTRP